MSFFQPVCRQLAQLEWLILLVLFPIVIFITTEQAPLLFMFPFMWLVRKIGTGRFFPQTPLNWALYGLLVMALVSLYASFDLDNSLRMVGGLILGISLYFALVTFIGDSQKRLYLALTGFIMAGVVVTIFGLIHPTFLNRLVIFQPIADLAPSRVIVFLGDVDGFNANRISGTLLWVAPLTWVLAGLSLVGVRRKDVSFWKASLLTIFLTGLALTMSLTLMFLFSRAAQASYLIIMFLLFALLAWKQRWLIIVGIIGVIAIGWFLASSPEYQLRVEQFLLTISGETTGGSTAVESLTGRNEIWNRAYYTIRDFPLTGVGMNNFPAVMTKYFPAFAIRNTSDVTHAHNQLLIIGTDLGVPGIIAYVALMLGILLMLWQSWRRAPRLWDKMLVIGFAASLTAFELFGLFDGIGLGEKPAVFFWFLLGLSGGLFHLIHQPTLPKSTILPK